MLLFKYLSYQKLKSIFNEYGISIEGIAQFCIAIYYLSRIGKVYRLTVTYTVNLAHSDCITVVVYGSLVDAHNL